MSSLRAILKFNIGAKGSGIIGYKRKNSILIPGKLENIKKVVLHLIKISPIKTGKALSDLKCINP